MLYNLRIWLAKLIDPRPQLQQPVVQGYCKGASTEAHGEDAFSLTLYIEGERPQWYQLAHLGGPLELGAR